MKAGMGSARVEAFTDGVMAVALTVMVLELKPPHVPELAAVIAQWPVALSYVLSFLYIGIYWNNHHHMMRAAENISGRVLWANLFLLFWITLIPFSTAWMSENHFAAVPVGLYGVVLLMAAASFLLLQREIIAVNGPQSGLGRAVGADWKGRLSLGLYLLAIGIAAWAPWASCLLYVAVALIWFVPDRRFERAAAP